MILYKNLMYSLIKLFYKIDIKIINKFKIV